MTAKLVLKQQPCPKCPSSDAYHEYDDGHGYCFSCKSYFPSKQSSLDLNDFTYEYLPTRGIDKKTLKFYDVKTKINKDGKPISIGFRYPNGSYKVRWVDRKEFYWEHGAKNDGSVGESDTGTSTASGLFGRDRFSAGEHRYIIITEGEFDALSCYQTLAVPAVSVRSASSAGSDCAMDRSFLNSFERIYLAFDNDTAGREAARAVARLFDFNKVYSLKFSKRKDANEFLQNGEADTLLNIYTNAKRYMPAVVKNSFEDFHEILNEPNQEGLRYPWPTLTSMTYGIRKGESVLITAQEGVGKTEVMHTIEHLILKETKDNVGAIFLEEPERDHLKAIAGLELGKPVHLPDCDVSVSEIEQGLKDAVGVDERLHVYSHFGSDDPETLLDTIRFLVTARSCNYILLDHITMAVSGLAGEDERRALDHLATRLEMMVTELNFALIMVSHVNDDGKTRGSRLISKVANTRIDLTRDVDSDNPIERSTTHVRVSKNRFGRKTGAAGNLMFDTKLNRLIEEQTYASSNAANGGNPQLAA